ncbi:MAG: hypothetical protein ACI82I_003435, partial [Gammaproteobacteria bacterium]
PLAQLQRIHTLSAHRRFNLPKCCALYEWLHWRAALQHFEVVAKGGSGPELIKWL